MPERPTAPANDAGDVRPAPARSPGAFTRTSRSDPNVPSAPPDDADARRSAGPAHVNRLAAEASPYLLQHAHNPVDWYPWGSEALERARAERRPIFLSIGYAACHWCHVMERESFEDPATAEQLNRDFVAIKVDREERPDLDHVYMTAVQAMTGQGGWPMSVFLTPEGRPFYGGTYFPAAARGGLPSFREVLAGVAAAWRERRAEIERSADQLVAAIEAQSSLDGRAAGSASGTASQGAPAGEGATAGAAIAVSTARPGGGLDRRGLDAAVLALERTFDARDGGWGGAPKFPLSMTIEFLLRRHAEAGDQSSLAMARRTLDAMAAGGIRDHVGGGFHRYATDAIWLVPHFEKMLYDNAQLARVYLHAFQVTGDARYRDVAASTLGYMQRELATGEGGFAASQDADTDGVEGATFTWQASDIEAALGDDALLFGAAYGVTPGGNWEGRTILRRARSDADLASTFGFEAGEVERRLREARSVLFERRNARPQPARDDKVVVAWNGLAIAALAEGAVVLGPESEPGAAALGAATRAASMLLDRLRDRHGRLHRSYRAGRIGPLGVLEDYADLADGLLALYGATFDERWFVAARGLLDVVLARFADPAGGFFDTADDAEPLVARPRDVQDNALPSGNAMAATTLLRIAALTGEGRPRDAAERAIARMGELPSRYPTGFSQWLIALDLAVTGTIEIAIVGDPAADDTRSLLAATRSGFRPSQVVAVTADPGSSTIELLQSRFALGGHATAFVCQDFACRQPVIEPEALAAQLEGSARA